MKGLEQDKDAKSMMLVYRKRTRGRTTERWFVVEIRSVKVEGAGQYPDSWKGNCSINDWGEEKWCFEVQGFDGQEE